MIMKGLGCRLTDYSLWVFSFIDPRKKNEYGIKQFGLDGGVYFWKRQKVVIILVHSEYKGAICYSTRFITFHVADCSIETVWNFPVYLHLLYYNLAISLNTCDNFH